MRNVIEALLPSAFAAFVIFIGKMTAKAITAVDGATTFDDQQAAIFILVQQAGHGVVLFIQWVM
ncbi:Uncharacterised protein [Vibrio cholerae]|uniref:Uncharacterized protein n=1 Tax=Vibrio cholerae TaxID=666 RepID=A0A655ZEM2_VIBCL|nr:Uncharacterised protein [Vibrio cholerae]CSA47011.1 Uncharacterised protein [Vibrio cholerae]CSB43850.1 Uncharacterised protein [Vibrio cholerae]CSC67140.1 Uncharacterised protein [Vibrio cholerae]CSD02496.1 Uncharacterised protein [Vibrio cholerae]